MEVELERSAGYENCLGDGVTFMRMSNWVKNATLYVLQRRNQTRGQAIEARLNGVSRAVQSVLGPWGFNGFHFSLNHNSLVLTHGEDDELLFAQLSDGVRTVAALTADIAFRATKLNPYLAERANKETPGIVLIDELELYLEPDRQRDVLTSLRHTFPRIQFIVSTNSPEILTSLGSESVRVLG